MSIIIQGMTVTSLAQNCRQFCFGMRFFIINDRKEPLLYRLYVTITILLLNIVTYYYSIIFIQRLSFFPILQNNYFDFSLSFRHDYYIF